jgi:acetyl-CoA synthetase
MKFPSIIPDIETYQEYYQKSIENPETFWTAQAEEYEWAEKWKTVKSTSFDKPVSIKWFEGGKLNITTNCIDRHLHDKANQTAIIWEADDPNEPSAHISYQQLHDEVCRLANSLKERGVQKGDRVTIYMPMVPEAAYAMLACARIGAIHSVIFGGFSPEAIRGRIENCQSEYIITADEGIRGNKLIPLKANVDKALENQPEVKHVWVLKRTGNDIHWVEGRDLWYHDEVAEQPTHCEAEVMDAEDPLFILYTSGSTGKPKGLMHTTAGYMIWASLTHRLMFGYEDGDIYWCTADVGWVTGHSYIVYGPLCNGAITLMFEGMPNYPDYSRFWQVVDKHKVNIFYTAPTAIRALMREGDEFVTKTDRSTLKTLGTVGEPINPEAWEWYHDVVGNKRCPVIDTWWQTETGGAMITPLPITPTKPGSATLPFFGVQPAIVDKDNHILEGKAEGALCILDSWPGQSRSLYGDHDRFEQIYYSDYSGKYFSGDGARRDEDDYYWITGRMDDVINVSGHRLGTAEIESALVEHHNVAEAAVVGYPHEIKGQGIYAYVLLNEGVEGNEATHAELIDLVKTHIGSIAKPEYIQFAPNLPKTRSGKIMRRILRKIAANDFDALGDTSTLMNPEIVDILINERLNRE